MHIEKLKEAAAKGKEAFVDEYFMQVFAWRDANGLRQPVGVWIEEIAQKWKEVTDGNED